MRSSRSCTQFRQKTYDMHARLLVQCQPINRLRHTYSTTAVSASEKRPEDRLTQFVNDRKASGASFQINGNSITVIDQPTNFYKALKVCSIHASDKCQPLQAGIFAAKSRIVLSSLYIGKEEKDLVSNDWDSILS